MVAEPSRRSCGSCSALNPPQAMFCAGCGYDLTGGSSEPPPRQPIRPAPDPIGAQARRSEREQHGRRQSILAPRLGRVLGASRQAAEAGAAFEAGRPDNAATRPEWIDNDPKRRAALEMSAKLRPLASEITRRGERAQAQVRALQARHEAEDNLREWLLRVFDTRPAAPPLHLSQLLPLLAPSMHVLPPLARAVAAAYAADGRRSAAETALVRSLYRRIESLPVRAYRYAGSAVVLLYTRYETDGATLLTDSALLSAEAAMGPSSSSEWAEIALDLRDASRRYLALRRETELFEQRHAHAVEVAERLIECYAVAYEACAALCEAARLPVSRWPAPPSTLSSYFASAELKVSQTTGRYSWP